MMAGTADALVLFGLAVMTLAVWGMVRLGDFYLRLHAASKTVSLGLLPLLAAGMATGDAAIIARSVLIAAFLLLTTPVSTHAIARAAHLSRRRSGTREPGDATSAGERVA